MSLIKSFNIEFLKQNFKKSKGAIILCLIIVPLILSLYLVVVGIEVDVPKIISSEVIGAIDLIFMYIIPFVFSSLLFGFVFKKSSTDFMNSMPINRKTMFVTNTIGGIILITIIQLLSGFVALLWGAIFSNLIIFPSVILDMIIISWISYVFVFIASNLAITVSGTQQTHFVVTVLILFLIPFCIEMLGSIIEDNNYYDYTNENVHYDIAIVDGYQTTYFDTLEKVKDYTMPFKLFKYGYTISLSTMIRMILLFIIYYILGLKLYQKRKMEFSEESFGSLRFHIFVKILTLIPILLFVNRINVYEESLTTIVVAIIMCAVYYIIFDIISKRKVPFIITIVSFVGTIFVIQAVSVFAENISHKQKEIDFEDIKAVSIGKNSNSADPYFYYTDSSEDVFDGDYYLQNKQILRLILDGRKKISNSESTYSQYDRYSTREIYFNIKMNSGKEYFIETTIARKNYNEIVDILSRNEKYMKHIEKQICHSNGVIELGNDIVDNRTKRKIENTMKENIEDLQLLSEREDEVYCITKSVYKNHKIMNYQIPLSQNNELLSVVAEFANNQTLENIKGYQYDIRVNVYDESGVVDSFYDNSEILDFMEEHADDEFDPTKKFFILSGGLDTRRGYKYFRFYTNSTKEVVKIVNNSKQDNYWEY